jgi:hypothetical protein
MSLYDLQRQAERLRRDAMTPGLGPLTIETRLELIELVLNRMEQRLFGNGQAGELSTLKARVTKLESWLWRGLGAIGLAVGVVEWTVRR